MTINSTNPYQNLAFFNPFSNFTNEKEILTSQQDNNELESFSFTTNTQNYASEFGFRINEQGFFDKDLNKIASLPNSYSINIKSIRSIVKEAMSKDKNLSFQAIDLPQLLNKYYSSLKSINTEFANDDNIQLNRNALSQLSAGFSTENGDFSTDINRIYTSQKELDLSLSHSTSLSTHMLENKIISFHFDKAIENTSSNELLKPYLTKNGEVSKSGLLMNFIFNDIKNTNEMPSFMDSFDSNLNSHQTMQRILKGETDIEDFIQENNKQKMSFDLYLYVNGIDKKTSSKEKLSLLYQQYINYEKNMDLTAFTHSSSIYQMYIDEVRNEFENMKKEYQEQSADTKRIQEANSNRSSSVENFLNRRTKQASLNRILRSYLSIMV
ncbi:hypothetical protein OQH60_08235 [Campylobacter sp. MIT 21-1685]|uniref:hypothetical protein n=1 Tax=unclassified Campylobacter TaxID=2593542 RepID=UPI00224AAD02|nr:MULTISPECIES: hypothetical protein [unclassified Campylobacter]MCX2683845.1 hypothetical protein [Campylobacter sp. MIT 21-1684]MCX2752129.1 hypothetical protein [Campylobacter sp. MIT 21-1682]MCX2808322.1 hypothetical protein [Campylobacter sp. MIT 21-1685]